MDVTFTLVVFLVLSGPFVGSFIAAACSRYANGEAWVFGRSKCTACQRVLAAKQLVPLVSYLLLKGRCQFCGHQIASIYIVTELVCLIISLVAVIAFGLSGLTVWALLLGWLLLGLSLIDILTLKLPRTMTLALIGMGVLFATLGPDVDLVTNILTGLVFFALFEAIRRGYLALRGRAGLGLGDSFLAAGLGVWLGPNIAPIGLLVACTLGIAWALLLRPVAAGASTQTTKIPFAPFLALGLWSTWLIANVTA